MTSRILVPVDFSAHADAALDYVRGLAPAVGATVHLLHVLPNLFLRPVVSNPDDLRAAAIDQLRERILAGPHPFPVTLAVERSDEPADEILSYARANEIDLIVVGTRGRNGVSHALKASIAEKVMRAAPCPVLMLRVAKQAASIPLPTSAARTA